VFFTFLDYTESAITIMPKVSVVKENSIKNTGFFVVGDNNLPCAVMTIKNIAQSGDVFNISIR